MRRILFLVILFLFCLTVNADELKQIEYEDITNKKIAIVNNNWTANVSRKDKNYFIKKDSSDITVYSNFYSSDGVFKFSTGTNYEFVYKGRLIGYSNSDLKFYEYEYFDNELWQRELIEEEVQELFPEYKIIKISDFFSSTNSLKLKKGKKDLKIILLNDTDKCYYDYVFYTNNGNFERYELSGFLNITQKSLIQFSRQDKDYRQSPWYVLLVR